MIRQSTIIIMYYVAMFNLSYVFMVKTYTIAHVKLLFIDLHGSICLKFTLTRWSS